jgi:arginase
MAGYTIIEAPSVLGLFPGGVERLPTALLEAGLAEALGARRAGVVIPPHYEPMRDATTGLLNPMGLRDYAFKLADATGEVLDSGEVPVVLGGDCSILLGDLLALRRRGRYGLLFIDGHADFYQPEAEPNGEAASMDLALATGRGPGVVADLEGRGPLVRDEDVVVLGRRDAEEAQRAGSQPIEDTPIAVLDLSIVRDRGAQRASDDALGRLRRSELGGFWIHLDCDVLDDAIMPAVDYRLQAD